jgi:SAM-dependent methyltransferase
MPQQRKQFEWAWQWEKVYDDNKWLFTEWIEPNTLETFRDKDVLDSGCGGGQHVNFIAPYARSVTGVDLNALKSAAQHTKEQKNVTLVEADIATMDIGRSFDVVYSIGVLHHTDDPDKSFANIVRHCKPGGRVIVWVYSSEGNTLNEYVLEPIKLLFLRFLPRPAVWYLAHFLTRVTYLPVYTLYLLPLTFLPYSEYFQNWRRLNYRRNLVNVFDKLNAPQTWFITGKQVRHWFSSERFTDVHVSRYRDVSWRASGIRR